MQPQFSIHSTGQDALVGLITTPEKSSHLDVVDLRHINQNPKDQEPSHSYQCIFGAGSSCGILRFVLQQEAPGTEPMEWPEELVLAAIQYYCDENKVTELLRVYKDSNQLIWESPDIDRYTAPQNLLDEVDLNIDTVTPELAELLSIFSDDEYASMSREEREQLLKKQLKN